MSHLQFRQMNAYTETCMAFAQCPRQASVSQDTQSSWQCAILTMPQAGLCVSRYTALVVVHHSRNAASRPLRLKMRSPGRSAPFTQCPSQASVSQDTQPW